MRFPSRGPWRLEAGASVLFGGIRFEVWAPYAKEASVVLSGGRRLPLAAGEGGRWMAFVPGLFAGERYGFSLDGGRVLPDPISRYQPEGVHALSEAIDPSFAWKDAGWKGVPLKDAVIYEAHVGAFTKEGSYAAMAAKLDHLKRLGANVLQLLPLAERPGKRNWGYDGTLHYSPHARFGRPDDLRRLVDACHRRGIAVCIDVVYNHMGPEGNYAGSFGPYFTERYRTPWGPALNYDGRGSDGVRRWAIENALYWITEFHVDALRLDAVQMIFDNSPWPLVAELKAVVAEQARRLGREVWLVAETDSQDSRLVREPAKGGLGFDAQWTDDFHHALHRSLTGERGGYYADYSGLGDVAAALRENYVFNGRFSPHHGRRHGSPAADVPPERFVISIQNHDQVGNRPLGERLSTLVGLERQKACAALMLLAPQTPMLFMGEEWGETRPFFYFTDHQHPGLAEAVKRGRRRDMLEFGWMEPPPDSQAASTLAKSRLDWSALKRAAHAGTLAWYRALLRLRREHPALGRASASRVTHGEDWLCFERRGRGGRLAVAVNFGKAARPWPELAGRWTILAASTERRFGGDGSKAVQGAPLPPGSAIVLGRR